MIRRDRLSGPVFIPNPKLKLSNCWTSAGRRFASGTIPTGRSKPTWDGLSVICGSAAGVVGPDSTDRGSGGLWRHPRDCGEADIKAFLSQRHRAGVYYFLTKVCFAAAAAFFN